MEVSIIIPAKNAAETLADTVRSIRDQTFGKWEALLIEDGSTDDTLEIARTLAADDGRIRVCVSPSRGVGAARNTGIDLARFDRLLFLDADDWIDPAHLAKFARVLDADPSLAGAYCGYAYVVTDGTHTDVPVWHSIHDLFASFAQTCAWAIHCCVVRRSLVREVGCFRTDLPTGEDWDLWQRIARTGAQFRAIPEILSYYRVRPRSASMDYFSMLRGGREVVTRGHSSDPRVSNPAPEYASGLPAERAPAARLTTVCWPAGLMIGNGMDARPLLDGIGDDRDPDFSPHTIAHCLFEAGRLPSSRAHRAWIDLLPRFNTNITLFLEALEEKTGARMLARRAQIILESMIHESVPIERNLVLGSTARVAIDIARPIGDLRFSDLVERVECPILVEGIHYGTITLPVCDRFIPGPILSDGIAEGTTWGLLDLFLEHSVYGTPGVFPAATLAHRFVSLIGNALGEKRGDFELWAFTSIGRYVFSRLLFPRKRIGSRPVDTSGDRITIHIPAPLPDVRVDGKNLVVKILFGGISVGFVTVRARNGIVGAGRIRRAILDGCGLEILRLTVREGLIGHPFTAPVDLAGRLAEKGRERISPVSNDDNQLTLIRRLSQETGTSASRRVRFPRNTAGDLEEMALQSGEEILRPEGKSNPGSVEYSPDRLILPGGESPGRVPEIESASMTRRSVDIADRFLQRSIPFYKKILGRRTVADRLPIVMYHRIAENGASGLARYRVPPRLFEEHLRHLKENNYYSVTLDEWRVAAARRRQLRGRPILITFDDGTRDFLDAAWPLLRKYGFGALVFLVAGEIGGSNSWDDAYGERVPLLSWPEIRRLQEEGVRFGSHTMTHRPLTALPPTEIVRELARSRTILQRGLERPVEAVAYPYGDVDPVVRHFAGGCGYLYGLTCRSEPSQYYHSLLDLPRFTAEGGGTLREFSSAIDPERKGGLP